MRPAAETVALKWDEPSNIKLKRQFVQMFLYKVRKDLRILRRGEGKKHLLHLEAGFRAYFHSLLIQNFRALFSDPALWSFTSFLGSKLNNPTEIPKKCI